MKVAGVPFEEKLILLFDAWLENKHRQGLAIGPGAGFN
jgi:hypothetical protein